VKIWGGAQICEGSVPGSNGHVPHQDKLVVELGDKTRNSRHTEKSTRREIGQTPIPIRNQVIPAVFELVARFHLRKILRAHEILVDFRVRLDELQDLALRKRPAAASSSALPKHVKRDIYVSKETCKRDLHTGALLRVCAQTRTRCFHLHALEASCSGISLHGHVRQTPQMERYAPLSLLSKPLPKLPSARKLGPFDDGGEYLLRYLLQQVSVGK